MSVDTPVEVSKQLYRLGSLHPHLCYGIMLLYTLKICNWNCIARQEVYMGLPDYSENRKGGVMG